MFNVLRQLFLRNRVREHERNPGDPIPLALPRAPNHGAPGEIPPMLGTGPVQAANDSRPVEQAHGSSLFEPASDPKPAKPPSDEETSNCRSWPFCRRGTGHRSARAESS